MQKKAFTLIELLVVIAIIGLLTAISIPALTYARSQGRTIFCLSNLRQLVIAAHAYSNENEGFYPIAYMSDPDPADSLSLLMDWDFIQTKNWDTNEQKIEPGILWQTTDAGKVQQCPCFTGPANSDVPYCGYNYNVSYIGHGTGEIVKKPIRPTDVKKPAECALFGDGEYYDGANKFMRSPWKSKYDSFSFKAAGTQGFRHNGKTNVAWCDGHTSAEKDCYMDTYPAEKQKILQHNQTSNIKVGFLSSDDSAYDLE